MDSSTKDLITLYNEDCLSVLKRLADQSVDMILVDEPFGTTRNHWDAPLNTAEMWTEKKRVIKKHGAILHFAVNPYTASLLNLHPKGYKFTWYWSKKQSGNFAVAKYQPMSVMEEILVFTGAGERVNYYPQMRTGKMRKRGSKNSDKHGRGFGGLKQVYYESDQYYPINILEFAAINHKQSYHAAQKPVPLLEYLIETHSKIGDTVLDYCMGSGSTGVAAKNLQRNFIGVENNKEYFKIAEQRINHAESE